MAAMRAREAEKPGLEGRVEVDDAYPGGQRTGGRRGRGAAGETPLLAAVETTAERRPGRLRLIAVEGFHEKGIEKIAGRDLAPAGSVATDGLSCRRAVEQAGRTHFPMTTGSGPQAARWIPLTRVGTAPGNIETALAGACRHVSAGHAQRHLASAARRLDRRLQLDSPTERLPTPARPAPLPYGLILAG